MFSSEQLAALSAEHHIIVSAAAGSGKTRVLVERYVRLLQAGVDPRSIVAITFTRKAAAEMLGRIAQRVDELLNDEAMPDAQREQLARSHQRLSSARISTIHSFCAALLREYPIEAGVSPDFRELGSGEAQRLRDTVIQRVLEERLEDPLFTHDTRRLIMFLGQKNLLQLLQRILRRPEDLLAMSALYSRKTDAEILAGLHEQHFREFVEFLKSIVEQLHHLDGRIVGKARTAVAEFSALLHNADLLLLKGDGVASETEHPVLIENLVRMVRAALDCVLGPRSFISALKSIAKELDEHSCAILLKARAGIIKREQTSKCMAVDAVMLRSARAVCELAVAMFAELSKEKNELAAFDFDDLQLRTRRLLENEQVRKSVRQSVPYLMIDEFQDTNALQYELVYSIVTALKSDSDIAVQPNVFIVGDAKQSIYGFRRADVRVFEEARHDILAANGRRFPPQEFNITHNEQPRLDFNAPLRDKPDEGVQRTSSTPRALGDVHLSTSFRMAPELVAFVNRICSTLMLERESEYDVDYEDLRCGRSSHSCAPVHIEFILGSIAPTQRSNSPDVARTSTPPEHQTEQDEEQSNATKTEYVSEAVLLADRLRSLLDAASGMTVWDEKRKERRPIQARDIAVLARNGTKLPKLMHELRLRSIPALRSGGRGFFDTQEVLDLMSALHVLANPDDDTHLAALLRSPYFAISDAVLYRLSEQCDPKQSLWSYLRSGSALRSADADPEQLGLRQVDGDMRLRRALDILWRLADQRPAASSSHLLRSLVRECGWYGSIEYSERAEQSRANVDKCLELVASLEQYGFRHVFDIVDELERLQQAEDNEAEAAVIGDENAIHLMTVHASKGLEFPLVVVYDMNFQSRHTPEVCMDEQLGLCFKVSDEEGARVSPYLRECALRREEAKDRAERKRLLYVALTRARDHLILSAEIKASQDSVLLSEQPSQGFLELFVRGIAFPLSTRSSAHVALELPISRWNAGQNSEGTIGVELILSTEIPHVSLTSDQGTELAALNKRGARILSPLSITLHSDESFSASHAMTYAADPLEYFRIYHLGLASSDEQRFQSRRMKADEDADRVSATLAGILIHAVLCELSRWIDDSATLNMTALSVTINDALYQHQLSSDHSIRARVEAEILNLFSQTILKPFVPALRKAKHEFSYMMPLADDFLNGTMDLLLTTAEAEVEVWDWKTNSLAQKNEDDWLAHYALQLKVYCLLLSYEYPEQEQFTARLIFTRSATMRQLSMRRAELQVFETELESMASKMKRCTVA